eukprot:5192538-Prymnesium_polylepis.1
MRCTASASAASAKAFACEAAAGCGCVCRRGAGRAWPGGTPSGGPRRAPRGGCAMPPSSPP